MIRMSKKRVNFYLGFIGLALIVYPFFTKGPIEDWGLGVALCLAAKYVW